MQVPKAEKPSYSLYDAGLWILSLERQQRRRPHGQLRLSLRGLSLLHLHLWEAIHFARSARRHAGLPGDNGDDRLYPSLWCDEHDTSEGGDRSPIRRHICGMKSWQQSSRFTQLLAHVQAPRQKRQRSQGRKSHGLCPDSASLDGAGGPLPPEARRRQKRCHGIIRCSLRPAHWDPRASSRSIDARRPPGVWIQFNNRTAVHSCRDRCCIEVPHLRGVSFPSHLLYVYMLVTTASENNCSTLGLPLSEQS
ncbi:uncharacterized protein LOC117801161 [Ailuropoda melanoleuca]|uniref:uncharacterized protein LOC117801161 n=1 Tax=Ailuropoda melanoleuca TaxID=9646 RepID=UPI001494DA3A|nr:uncharacterized protein LOC117801161 [Ailuropoda melanoleuca]